MTRPAIVLAAAACAALVASCAPARRHAPAATSTGNVLFVGTTHGIAAVRPADGSVAYSVAGGVAAPDWSVLYRTTPAGSGTTVTALAPDGSTRWSEQVDGHLGVKLAAPGGATVVLGPRYSGTGRPRTDLVVGRMGIARPTFRTFHVPGNVEPEAMSLDGSTLFLIEYVPAMHPTGYLLRRLELASGDLGDVRRVDEDETGVMHAVARTHVMARDGSRLYTLYTVPGRRAFVHVLDLRDKYAHCVDLPLPFGTGPQSAVALTLTHDGSRLFVADRHSGATAVIDTGQLVIDSTGTVPMAGSGGPAGAVLGIDGTLYLASGRHLVSVLPMSLDYQRAVSLPGTATAVGLGPSGEVVAGLSHGGGLVFVDPVTGRTTAHLRSSAFDGIQFIGAVAAAPLGEARTTMQCAC
jgi:hypothetical protein